MTHVVGAKPVAEAMPGDVMIFREGGHSCHAAILGYKGDLLTIIHAHAARRKVMEEYLNQGSWLENRVACFEFRGLE